MYELHRNKVKSNIRRRRIDTETCKMHFGYTKNIALCETYRVTAFFGRAKFRKGEDEFMRSIGGIPSGLHFGFGAAPPPSMIFIESDNMSYHTFKAMCQ